MSYWSSGIGAEDRWHRWHLSIGRHGCNASKVIDEQVM